MDCRRGSILSPGRCIDSDPNSRVRYAMHSNRTHQQQPTVLPQQVRLPGQLFSTNPLTKPLFRRRSTLGPAIPESHLFLGTKNTSQGRNVDIILSFLSDVYSAKSIILFFSVSDTSTFLLLLRLQENGQSLS